MHTKDGNGISGIEVSVDVNIDDVDGRQSIDALSKEEAVCRMFGVPPIRPSDTEDDYHEKMYVDLGTYTIPNVTNRCGHDEENTMSINAGAEYFDLAYRLQMSYQHELASRCYLASLYYNPHCAMAHAFLALGTCAAFVDS
jgi:hypothetical protein